MDFPSAKTSTTIKIDIPQNGTFDDVDHILIPHYPPNDQARSAEELLAFSSFAVLHSVLTGISPLAAIKICDWYLSVMSCQVPEYSESNRKSGLDGWAIHVLEADGKLNYNTSPLFFGNETAGFAPEEEYVQFAKLFAEYAGDQIDDERLLQRFSCVHLEMISYYLKNCIIQSLTEDKVDLTGLRLTTAHKMVGYREQVPLIWEDEDLLVCTKTFKKHLRRAEKLLDKAKHLCGGRQNQTARRL